LCHCQECRRTSGAPMVAWAGFSDSQLTVTKGSPKGLNTLSGAIRSFCADCGTSFFYHNAELVPGMVYVQTATLDDPNALPPTAQIFTVEGISWMKDAHELPAFERFAE
jgi:hypothetical protein